MEDADGLMEKRHEVESLRSITRKERRRGTRDDAETDILHSSFGVAGWTLYVIEELEREVARTDRCPARSTKMKLRSRCAVVWSLRRTLEVMSS